MHRALVAIVTTAALTVGSAAAVGVEPAPHHGAPGIGDPYFPVDGNGGYDVEHYDIKLAYDPSTDAIRATTTLRAKALQSLSRFDLDLVGLQIDSLRVSGSTASWTRTRHELEVTPEHPLSSGHNFSVTVEYHGVPRLLKESRVSRAGWFTTGDGALVAGQPHGAAAWFPVNDHPLDKATYDIAITVPRGLEAVSNGALASKHTHGRHTTWTWKETAPMASYLATATTGQFDLHSYQRSGIRYVDAIDPTLFRRPQPRTGRRFAVSGSGSSAYHRLIRTIAVPARGGSLRFHVRRDTEPGWDFFAVEARRPGTDSWTTLPDRNGHTARATGDSCPYWLSIHPFLKHYQTDDGAGGCRPRGRTGTWHAASGASDGYETWTVDLSAYAGKRVQVALSVIDDDAISYPGTWVDDIVGPGGVGSTSFEKDGNINDGWRAVGAPTGSPKDTTHWTVSASDPRPTIGDRVRTVFAEQPRILRFLSGVLGPYPFKQAGGIVDDDPGIGFALENQTRPTYSKDFFTYDDPGNDSVITHELTHQWTGDDLALGRWRDIWLNEGFATYLEWLWSEHEGRVSVKRYFDYYASIPSNDPFWSLRIGDPGPEDLFADPVYSRGAMTLHRLRQRIGDRDFFRLVKRWTALHAGGNVTTPQFEALAERISGRGLGHLFRTWLYTPSKPASLPKTAPERLQAPTSAPEAGRRAQHLLARPRG